MAKPVTHYEAIDGTPFPTEAEADAHDIALKRGEMMDKFIDTLGMSKGQKILKKRLILWEQYVQKSSQDTDSEES